MLWLVKNEIHPCSYGAFLLSKFNSLKSNINIVNRSTLFGNERTNLYLLSGIERVLVKSIKHLWHRVNICNFHPRRTIHIRIDNTFSNRSTLSRIDQCFLELNRPSINIPLTCFHFTSIGDYFPRFPISVFFNIFPVKISLKCGIQWKIMKESSRFMQDCAWEISVKNVWIIYFYRQLDLPGHCNISMF
jgi:hypothetical protein